MMHKILETSSKDDADRLARALAPLRLEVKPARGGKHALFCEGVTREAALERVLQELAGAFLKASAFRIAGNLILGDKHEVHHHGK